MVYQRVSKPYSGNSQIHKKDSASTVNKMPVQTKSVSASPQEQEMPSYTPLAANWATNNNLMRSLSGNQVVQRQEESAEEEMEPIQAKLTIGEVGDKYEQEADQTAQQVVNQINAPAPQQSTQSQSLQREEMPEDELQMKPASDNIIQREEMPEDELQMKPASDNIIQREEMPENELQMKPEIQRKSDGGGMDATPDLEASIQQAKGGGQPIADNIREPMEKAFGADFSGVNVHTDAHSDQLNQSIQAKAFTTGQDVFFRQGAYEPGSRGGQELIAHELTHVVQQSGGAVQRKSLSDGETTGETKPALAPIPTTVDKNDAQKKTSSTSSFQFVDNRLEAIAPRQLQRLSTHKTPAVQKQAYANLNNLSSGHIQRVLAGSLLESNINQAYLLNFTDQHPELRVYKNRLAVLEFLTRPTTAKVESNDDLLREIPAAMKFLGLGAPALGAPQAVPSQVAPQKPSPRAAPKASPQKPSPQAAPKTAPKAAPAHADPPVQADPNSQGKHNVVPSRKGDGSFSEECILIPATLTIRNLFRGDTGNRDELLSRNGFRPGKHATGYVEKLRSYVSAMNVQDSEAASKAAVDRNRGIDMNKVVPGPEKGTMDFVGSDEKVEIGNGKSIMLLNWVCTGSSSGAGGEDYMIKVEDTFKCITASPTIGLYQSTSGMQIIAFAASGKSNAGYAAFSEYDFLTPIPPSMIYFQSLNGGTTQHSRGPWYNLKDLSPR